MEHTATDLGTRGFLAGVDARLRAKDNIMDRQSARIAQLETDLGMARDRIRELDALLLATQAPSPNPQVGLTITWPSGRTEPMFVGDKFDLTVKRV